MSERWVLFVLALPWLAIGLWPGWSSTAEVTTAVPMWQRAEFVCHCAAGAHHGFHQPVV